jgi:uncharacterized protein
MVTFSVLMSKTTSPESWTLPIRAIPNAARSEILGWEQDVLKVKLQAVPEDGKANKELIKLFAKTLKVAKSAIFLDAGEKSRHKRLIISGISRADFFQKLGIEDLTEGS